ncbi:2411_t:CDS:1, partial [Funneliformis geosporum]
YQNMEDEDLFEGEDSSEEDDEIVILCLTSLLGIQYFEQRDYVIKLKD